MYLNEFDATLQKIQGKWKTVILYELYENNVVRFNAMQEKIKDISSKTLTNQLRELERDELIIRTVHPVIPPHVDYELSEKGQSLIPVLDMICDWGLNNTDSKLLQTILCKETILERKL